MSRFAEQANKAAKALSTTTNEYAKASLIYYQQGLSDEKVKELNEKVREVYNKIKLPSNPTLSRIFIFFVIKFI